MRLGTLAAMWPGLTSPSVSPAPLPGLGLGLATPLAALARGWDRLDLLADAKPKEGRAWGCTLPETFFRGSVKTVGCFPRDKLDCAWGPRPPCGRGSRPRASAPTSSRPGLGSSDAPDDPSPGWDPQYLLADAKPKEGLAQGCTLPETVF